MAYKCFITRDYCKAIDAGFWDNGDSCPIQRYKNSSYEIEQDYFYISDTCRYYGIERAKELQKIFKEDF